MRVVVIAALTALATARCAPQPGLPSDHFDTARTISLNGRVATLVLPPSAHTYVLIDVQGATGTAERWAVRGRPIAELEWTPRNPPLKPGDPVTVVAYPAKAGANLIATVPDQPARLIEVTKAGRLVHGVEFTLANGSKLAFGGR